MIRRAISPHSIWTLICFGLILLLALFDINVITASRLTQVQIIPDDAFYYLRVAENFASHGTWSIDGGHSLSSGFHPLFVYLLTLSYKILNPGTDTFVQVGLGLTSIFTIAAVLIVWREGLRQRSAYFLLVASIIISSKNFVTNSVSIMEWPFTLLISILYCVFFYHSAAHTGKRNLAILFFLGAAGSISRSDFGILPFSIMAAAIVLHLLFRHKLVLQSFIGFLGAFAGLLCVFINDFVFTGYFIQSSIRIKAFWGSISGGDLIYGIYYIFSLLGIEKNDLILMAVLFILIVSCLIFIILKSRKEKKKIFSIKCLIEKPTETTLVLGSVFSLAGFFIEFIRVTDIQPWYTANLIVPVFILVYAATNYLDSIININFRKTGTAPDKNSLLSLREEKNRGFRNPVFLILSLACVLLIARNLSQRDLNNPSFFPWPHQQSFLSAGNYLKENKFDGNIGAWDAGIVGYYQGGDIINLDGLVNDQVQEYIFNNDLPDYLRKENIRYLIDFDLVFSAEYQKRGGYEIPQFIEKLQPVRIFGEGFTQFGNLALYKIGN